ncbi:DNA polymerase delta, subunit 4-domain-containing protein [Daedaleopsis nitida]|nr:DNA polymerase delta, subunit 4-domain-containing protein [Daedaleopsis nitida]
MKQVKLPFASKRTTSATAVGKAAAKPRKQPTRASSSPETILISDSSEDELDVPVMKRRRLAATAGQKTRLVACADEDSEDESLRKVEPEPERERLATSDRRWRRLYGEVRDKMGNIEPVHGQGQTMVNHILRVFDLSYEYGPCVGISRLQRWERAQALGLNPPPEVKEILMTKEGSTEEEYTQSVFYGEV